MSKRTIVFDHLVTLTNGQGFEIEYDTNGEPIKVTGPDGKPIPMHVEQEPDA